jgi:hypothetical protein
MQKSIEARDHNKQMSRRSILAMTGVVAGSALLAACGGAHAATPTQRTGIRPTGTNPATAVPTGSADTDHILAIEAFDFGYRMLGSIPGGVTTVRLTNTGQDLHHAQLLLLNPDVSLDQFSAALQQGPEGVFPLASVAGGPGLTAPNGTAEVILDLKPGQYMIVCFVPGADHVPHAAKGMVMPLVVTAPTAAPIPLPSTTTTVTLADFSFEMPTTLSAGRKMYRVVNQGAQFHEFNIIKIAPGKSLADVKAFFDPSPGTPPAGPPPGLPMGGMNALGKGGSGVVMLDLTIGDYAAICNVPDQSRPHGDSHLHLGMIKGFSVT